MNRRGLLAALAGAAILAVTACSTPAEDPIGSPDTPNSDASGVFTVTTVKVGDRSIPCVTWKQGYGGGISCDWAAAR